MLSKANTQVNSEAVPMAFQARHVESGGVGTAVTPSTINSGVCVRGTVTTGAVANPAGETVGMVRAESATGNASQSVERATARVPPAPEVVAEVAAESNTAAEDCQPSDGHRTNSVATGNSLASRDDDNAGVRSKHELQQATSGAGETEAHLARAATSAMTKLSITPTPAPPATPPAAAPPPLLHASMSNPVASEAPVLAIEAPFPHAQTISQSQTAPLVSVSSSAADSDEICSAAKAEPVPSSGSTARPKVFPDNNEAAASTSSASSSASSAVVTSAAAEARRKMSGHSVSTATCALSPTSINATALSAGNATRPPPLVSGVTEVQQQSREPVVNPSASQQPPPLTPSRDACSAVASATEETHDTPIVVEVTLTTPPQGHSLASAASVDAAGYVSAEAINARPQHSFACSSSSPRPAATLAGIGSIFAGDAAAKAAPAGRTVEGIASLQQQQQLLSNSCCAAPVAAASTCNGQQGKAVSNAQSAVASRGLAVAGAQPLQANGPTHTTVGHGASAVYARAIEGGVRSSAGAAAAIGGVCRVIAGTGNTGDSVASGRRPQPALGQALPLPPQPPPPPGYVRAMAPGAAGGVMMGTHKGGLHVSLFFLSSILLCLSVYYSSVEEDVFDMVLR